MLALNASKALSNGLNSAIVRYDRFALVYPVLVLRIAKALEASPVYGGTLVNSRMRIDWARLTGSIVFNLSSRMPTNFPSAMARLRALSMKAEMFRAVLEICWLASRSLTVGNATAANSTMIARTISSSTNVYAARRRHVV